MMSDSLVTVISQSNKKRQGIYYTIKDSDRRVQRGYNTDRHLDGLTSHWKQVVTLVAREKKVKGKTKYDSYTSHVRINN